jgi:hypothetical protein
LALIQGPKFASKKLRDIRRPERVFTFAIETLKLPAANALTQQELHGFFALRAGRGRGVFGHDAHAGSGASATNSLSPIAAGTGAVMAKIYRFKKRVVCTVSDSKIDSPVL